MKFDLVRIIRTPKGDWFGKEVQWEINCVYENNAGFYFIHNKKYFFLSQAPLKNGIRRNFLECFRTSGHGYSSKYRFRNIETILELTRKVSEK